LILPALKICGRNNDNTYNTGDFAGCEVTSGPIIIVAGFPSHAHYILMHELGHRVGAGHHTFSSGPKCTVTKPKGLSDLLFRNVMYCRVHNQRTYTTDANCKAFQDQQIALLNTDATFPDNPPGTAPTEVAEAAESAGAIASAPEPLDLKELLLEEFSDADPHLDEISRLTVEQIDILPDILADNKLKEYWGGAVSVMGLAGPERFAGALDEFLTRVAGDSSSTALRAKTNVGPALGTLAARHGTHAAEEILPLLVKRISMEGANKVASDKDAPYIARSFARGIANSGNAAVMQILVDALPKAEESGSIFRLDRDYVEMLAGISVDISTRGFIAHTQKPEVLSEPLEKLQALAQESVLPGPAVVESLAAIPEFKASETLGKQMQFWSAPAVVRQPNLDTF
jgi:hypothetical protein